MTRAEGIAALTAGMAAAIVTLLMLARWLVGRRPHTGTRAITAPRPRPATVPRKDTKGEPPWPDLPPADTDWFAALKVADQKRAEPPPTVAHMIGASTSGCWQRRDTAPSAPVPQPREAAPIAEAFAVPESVPPFDWEKSAAGVADKAREVLGVTHG